MCALVGDGQEGSTCRTGHVIERTGVRFFRDFCLRGGRSRAIFDVKLTRKAATILSAAFNGRNCCSGASTRRTPTDSPVPPQCWGDRTPAGGGAKAAARSAGDDGGGMTNKG